MVNLLYDVCHLLSSRVAAHLVLAADDNRSNVVNRNLQEGGLSSCDSLKKNAPRAQRMGWRGSRTATRIANPRETAIAIDTVVMNQAARAVINSLARISEPLVVLIVS